MSILYWVCYPSAQAKPTAAQVRAGQNASGAPLPSGSFGNQTVTLTGSGTFTWTVGATFLLPSTSYKFAAVTDLGNDAAVVESTAWTTLSSGVVTGATSETFVLTDAQNVQVTYVVAEAESVALSDSQNATVTTGPVTYSVTRAEFFTLSDSSTGQVSNVVNPPWANVVTLLHNDGSGVFTDSSGYQWPITNISAAHGTPAKFGDAAQLFPGYFTIDGTKPEFAFGTGDLTIELQLYRVPGQTGLSLGWTAVGGDVYFGADGFGDLLFSLPGGGSGSAGGLLANGYTWVVVTRASGVWTIWRNLAQSWTSNSGPAASSTPGGLMYYGRAGTGTPIQGGLQDEVRITRGIALYTQASPPTVLPTSPYPDGPPFGNIIDVAQAESVALSDSQNAIVVSGAASTVLETVTLSHTQNAAAIYGRNRAEVVTLSDTYASPTSIWAVSRAESITLSDTQTGAVQSIYTGAVNESFTLNAQQDAYVGALPVSKLGHFGEPPRWGAKEAERAMIQLEDEFILEIVLSLAVKGAIA